ncbi:hypothetical protein AB0I55_02155 [Actinocatenispora sera]|uniref:hypothetical protein n=1 Tax=Actinocatenispora sera TaxID=390989 RepID=UPI0033DBAFBF
MDDVAGSIAARRALGPDAEEAVIRAFLERTGQEIDRRVDERLARTQPVPPPPMPAPAPPPPQRQPSGVDHTPFVLAIVSIGAGIPLTGIATQLQGSTLIGIVIIWAGLVLINVVYGMRRH